MRDRCLALKAFVLADASAMLPLRLLAERLSLIAEEWQSLFNGRDREGWKSFNDKVGNRDMHHVFSIDQGNLHFVSPKFDHAQKSTIEHIATRREWSNYHVRLGLKWGYERFSPRSL